MHSAPPQRKLTTAQKDKIEGMAWARAWREANKGRDLSLEPVPCCPTCQRPLP